MGVSLAFPHRLAGHCASGAFRDLFEWRGYRDGAEPWDEATVFGIGAGLDFLYLSSPAPRVPFYLGGRAPMLEESLLARIGGSLYRRAETDPEAAWAHVKHALDAGHPAAMVGDCQRLEYLNTRTSMPLHVFVVTGYDDTHVTIADNDRETLQPCSHASLRAARAAEGFPLPAMHVTFEIDWPVSVPPVRSLLVSSLAETVAWMQDPHGPPALLLGRESFGLPALHRLERDARTWIDAPPAPPMMCAALLWIAIEKGGTGGGFFRRLFRDFLARAAREIPSRSMEAAHAHYAGLSDRWTALGRACASGRFTGAAGELVALAQAEREGVALLDRAVQSA